MKVLNLIRVLLNYLSVYWLVILFISVFYIFIVYGYFPELSRPDPKNVIPNFNILFIIYNSIGWTLIICLVLNTVHIFLSIINKKKWIDPSMIFLFINLMLLIIQIFIDPFGFNAWFFD